MLKKKWYYYSISQGKSFIGAGDRVKSFVWEWGPLGSSEIPREPLAPTTVVLSKWDAPSFMGDRDRRYNHLAIS